MSDPSAPPTRTDLSPDIVEGARRRDPQAMIAVYRSLSPSIFGYLLRQTRNPTWAEDLTAEVFCEVIEAVDRFEGTPGGFRAWIFRIARNTMLDHIRKESRRRHDSLDAAAAEGRLPEDAADPEADALERVERERILSLVDELSADQREVVVLRLVADLSVAEVARICDKTEGAVKALQHRAIRALATKLEQDDATGA